MFLYHSTNCLLVLAMLVLLCVPNGLEVIVTAGSVTIGAATFGGMLST